MQLFPRPRFLNSEPPRGGYTIIELLVVVVITAFLASFVFSYGSGSRGQLALMVERAKIVQTVFRARSLAISTFSQPLAPCAYGVHFDYGSGRYSLMSYSAASCRDVPSVLASGVVKEAQSLSSGLVYETGPNAIADVLFFPPDPTTVIFVNTSATSTSGFVDIKTADGAGRATISVTSAGQVSF